MHNTYKVPPGTRLPSSAYGEFLGVRGNSAFRLNDETADLLGLAQGTSVNFKKGRVDFSPFSQRNLRVKNLTGDHSVDIPLIHEHLAQRLKLLKSDGSPNAAAAERYLSQRNLSPHHAGGSLVQLIDTQLHRTIRHTGGAYDLRLG